MALPINSFKPLQKAMPDQKQMDEKLKEVSGLYEKQFLRQMVKEMRQTVHHSGMTEQSMTEKIFQEKLDHEYVEEWGANGGIGLADIIYSQLKDKFAPLGSALPQPKGPLPLQKGSTIKIDETESEFKKIKPSDSIQKNPEMTLHLQPANGGSDARVVQAPWNGVIRAHIKGPDEQNTIRIRHDEGMESVMHFKGNLAQKEIGQTIEAGEVLGTVSPDNSPLTWKIVQVET